MTPRNVRLIILAIILSGCHSAPLELGVRVPIVDHHSMRLSGRNHKAPANVNREVRFTYLPADVQSIVWNYRKYEPVELDREIVEPILDRIFDDDHVPKPRSDYAVNPPTLGVVSGGQLVAKCAGAEVTCCFFQRGEEDFLHCWLYGAEVWFRLDPKDLRDLYDHISERCCSSSTPPPCLSLGQRPMKSREP